jgi:hypothetical protein
VWHATSSEPERTRVAETRVTLDDGATTTVHAVWHLRRATEVRLVALERPEPLATWCRHRKVREAVVGGFFTRPQGRPLGELRLNGRSMPSVPFDPPWGGVRACLHVSAGELRIARRDRLASRPGGDLLQAGPLLVADGRVACGPEDVEGFRAGARQFDSDVTAGRYPRAALAVTDEHLLAVAGDGRGAQDAGLTLEELAQLLVDWGAQHALNLDGGGSASLVSSGRLLNRPREAHGIDLLEGRPVSTAVVFLPRR